MIETTATSPPSVFARFKAILPYLGPAFIASIAYMDPGNFATNIQGGAKFGYTLLWVVVLSNVMAMLIQSLSAKLGIATNHNLAELCRDHFSRPVVIMMWLMMEVVAIATDLAEFVGAAVGFNLLFGFPLWLAGILTAVLTFVILGLEKRGSRPLELVIMVFVGIIAVCYVAETFLTHPPFGMIVRHAVFPGFAGKESVVIAAGILGATVMPHVIFLHSSLTQGRIAIREPEQLRRLFRFELLDILVAMGCAGFVNAAMLIMAASTFHGHGLTNVGTIEEAHRTLSPLLGPGSALIFGISLLASGLSSSAVGTMAGQVIMQGFIRKRIPVWSRRLVTVVPSMIVILAGVDATQALVLSQVILSFGLPFAVIPLLLFTQRKDLMGVLVNRRWTTVAGWIVAALIVILNCYLIFQTIEQAVRGG